MRARSHAAVALAALGCLLGSGLLTAPPAYAADTWTIPGSATITVKGHGYGHGNGMSQHSAQGAARQGKNHGQILRFFYPGTRWGTVGGKIRVLVTADTTRDVVVSGRSGLRLRALRSGRTWRLDKARPKAVRWRVLPVGGGARSRIAYRLKGSSTWRRWRELAGDAELSAGGAPVRLHLPGGRQVTYRGALRSASPAGAGADRDTVNVVSLENYLRGVVPLEMPALWHQEAVRSQAVAARSYAAYERAHAPKRHYQVCDTTACQVYGGASAEHPASDRAVAGTARRVRTWQGRPAFTQFSASSGGWTSSGSQPYLKAKKDPYDGWSGNPHHSWSQRVGDGAIESRWPGVGNLRRITFADREGNGQWGGRVGRVVLRGSAGTVRLSGDDFRFGLGLRSTWLHLRVS